VVESVAEGLVLTRQDRLEDHAPATQVTRNDGPDPGEAIELALPLFGQEDADDIGIVPTGLN